MNININVENLEKKRENYGYCKVLDGLQDVSFIPEINLRLSAWSEGPS